MYVVIASLHLKPGRKDDFMAAMREDSEATMAREEYVYAFDVVEDERDPDRLHLVEVYRMRATPPSDLPPLPEHLDGVVLTFVDLSGIRLLTLAKLFAESIVDAVRQPRLVLDGEEQRRSGGGPIGGRVFHVR